MCFTVQLSKIVLHCRLSQTALLLYHVISCLSRTFFNFFEVVFISLSQQLWYLITSNRLLSRTFSFLFIALCQTQLVYVITSLFRCQELFSFLSTNAEGGIWTLARRKPSIPLAGAPLQPLEYFCTSLITQWAKSIILKHFTFVNGIFYISSNLKISTFFSTKF